VNPPPHLQDFLTHLAENEDFQPEHQFWARVTLAKQAPTFSYTLPRGEIVLYPKYLVFLTLSEDRPGAKLMFKEYVETVASTYKSAHKLNEWVEHPATLLFDLAKWLTKDFKDEDTLAKALISPNSVFVPVEQINAIKFVKGIIALRPHHIVVHLPDNNLIIYQDPVTENQFKSLIGQFTGKWQEEFQEALRSIVRENSSK
jgi:hypothetical protein